MEWNGMEWVVILVLVLPVLEYILLLIPFHSIRHSIPLETLPVSVGSSQRFAVDMLLVDRVTATGEDARSPGPGVAHAYPWG